MADYELTQECYLYPTPAGAYYAVAKSQQDIPRTFLLALMQLPETPKLTENILMELSGLEKEGALQLLYQLQHLGLLQGLDQPVLIADETLETILPPKLKELSGNKKSLLADDQGFYIATHGFDHDNAEKIAGFAAELSKLQARYAGLLTDNLNDQSAALGFINAAGQSDIGFWPIYIGDQRFTLVLSGVPCFNKNAIVEVVWILVNRYGSKQ